MMGFWFVLGLGCLFGGWRQCLGFLSSFWVFGGFVWCFFFSMFGVCLDFVLFFY